MWLTGCDLGSATVADSWALPLRMMSQLCQGLGGRSKQPVFICVGIPRKYRLPSVTQCFGSRVGELARESEGSMQTAQVSFFHSGLPPEGVAQTRRV